MRTENRAPRFVIWTYSEAVLTVKTSVFDFAMFANLAQRALHFAILQIMSNNGKPETSISEWSKIQKQGFKIDFNYR